MSNQIVEKKRKEMAIVNAFRLRRDDFPVGVLDCTDENPDAVVTTELGHTVGIELTELPIDSRDRQGVRSNIRYASHILRIAKKLYFEGGHTPVRVVASFDERVGLGKRDVPLLSRKLTEFVSQVAKQDWTGDVYIENMHYDLDVLPMAFQSMWIERAASEIDWDRSGGGCFAPMTTEVVQAKLAEKESRISDYRRRCAELWLVIFYDTDEAAWFEVTDAIFEHTFETHFDRVFLFNWFRQQAMELRVARA
jgi:hypothetical protein